MQSVKFTCILIMMGCDLISYLLKDIAYEKLLDMINDGQIVYDETYSLNVLAKHLDMGRTPVRDALMRLSDEAVIDILPSRGFRLHRIDQTEMRQLYHYSVAIEGYCAAHLAKCVRDHIENPYIAKLNHVHTQLISLFEENAVFSEFYALDNEFHHIINDSLEDVFFDNMTRLKRGFTDRPELHLTGQPSVQKEIIECHKEIVEAINTGNPDRTYHAVEVHADLIFNRYMAMVSETNQICHKE